MKKRTWHYILRPTAFEMSCRLCRGTNLWWSEYEHHIWCYDCEKDVDGFGGIFDGPIGVEVAYMLGLNFDRYMLETDTVEVFNKDTMEWEKGITPGEYDDRLANKELVK